MQTFTGKDYIIPLLALVCIIALLFMGPVPQYQSYHNFADQRGAFDIPNFLNVVTNLPFAFVAVLGFGVVRNTGERELKHIIFLLFFGLLLVTFGSGYYHLWPNNKTLVYDRIPITIILMSFFAFVVHGCIGTKTGYKAFILFNLLGVLSVVYWGLTERAGNGDLRWYGMVQFFPIIAIPLMLWLYKPSFSRGKEIIMVFLFFGLAKFTDTFDKEIYEFLGNTISGHSLKHLLMAAAGYEMVLLMRKMPNQITNHGSKIIKPE